MALQESEDDLLKTLQDLLDEQEIAAAQNRDAPQQPLVPPPEPLPEPQPLTSLADEIPLRERPAPPPMPPAQINPEPQPHQELANLIGPELQQEIPLDPELISAERPSMAQRLEPKILPGPEQGPPRPIDTSPSLMEQALLNLTKTVGITSEALEPQRQMIAKPMAGAAAIPWLVPAGFEAIRGLQHYDAAEREKSQIQAEWLQTQGIGAYTAVHNILGAKVVPTTPVEYASGVLGGSAIPQARMATALVAGVQFAGDWLRGDPMGGRPAMPKEIAEALLTPAEAAPAAQKPGVEPQPGMDLEPPLPMKKPRLPTPQKGETDASFGKRMEAFEKNKDEWLKQYNPTARHILNTVGGMRAVKDSDLWGMGYLAIGTTGMIATPLVGRMMYNVMVPKPMSPAEVGFRDVKGAKPGTVDITGPMDILRMTVDDRNLAPVRIARKALMDPDKIQHLDGLLRAQGFGQGEAMIDSAIRLGEMNAYTMSFKSPVSIEKLGQAVAQTNGAKRYLILRDIEEEINYQEQQAKVRPNEPTVELGKVVGQLHTPDSGTYVKEFGATQKDIVVNGLSFDEAFAARKAMEEFNPDLIKIGEMWDRWHADRRAYAADGEAATLRKERKDENRPELRDRSEAYLNDQRKSEVPFAGERDNGMPFEDRVIHTDIIDALEKRSRGDFKERNNNEIKLTFVDEMNSLDLGDPNKKYFTKVSQEELNQNPRWKPYAIEVFRRGEKEIYLTSRTMVDMLNLDPYVIQSGIPQYLNNAKRLFEFNYTGHGNPVFAFANAMRVWHGAKSMNLNGKEPPTLIGMAKSVPDQLYPQMAKWIVNELDKGTGGRAAQFFGSMLGKDNAQSQAALEGLGRKLAPIMDDAFFRAVESRGGVHGSTLTQQLRKDRENRITRESEFAEAETKMQAAGKMAQTFWSGWKKAWGAVHEAPMYDYVHRNLGKDTIANLINQGRDLGGDPKIGGQYLYINERTGNREPIHFESDSMTQKLAVAAIRPIGASAEFVRTAIPYGNAIIQSLKRVGTAYLDNPVLFTAKVWQYTALPAAGQYMWNYSMGTDPNGLRYVDYMMNYRPLYEQLTKWYFAIPGRPAEDGVKLSAVALEHGFPKLGTEIVLDHMFGQHKLDLRSDMLRALGGAMDISANIPMMPIIALWEASQGRVAPMNIFGGEAIKRSKDPYDQYQGMPESIERYVRAFGGGMGSMFGAAVAAYTHTEEGFFNGLRNAASEGAKTQLRNVPFLPNIIDVGPKISGSNRITEEYFAKQKHIDKLISYYKKSDLGSGAINTKSASEQGGPLATDATQMEPIVPITPGPPQPPPTNELYKQFMGDLYNRIKRDNPGYSQHGEDLGGIGFVSIMRRYGDASRAIRTLENVDDGLHVTWQRWMNEPKNKEMMDELKNNKVDPTNVRQVRNFYERNRQGVALTLLYYVKAIEKEFTDRARSRGYKGPDITIEMIEPYRTGEVNNWLGKFGDPEFALPEAFSQRFPASEGGMPPE